jgi:hypothetical protein
MLGFFAMFFGMYFFFSPLLILLKWIPLLGEAVNYIFLLFSFLFTLFLSTLTSAFAWLFFRPVLAICLIGIAVASFFLAHYAL